MKHFYTQMDCEDSKFYELIRYEKHRINYSYYRIYFWHIEKIHVERSSELFIIILHRNGFYSKQFSQIEE